MYLGDDKDNGGPDMGDDGWITAAPIWIMAADTQIGAAVIPIATRKSPDYISLPIIPPPSPKIWPGFILAVLQHFK